MAGNITQINNLNQFENKTQTLEARTFSVSNIYKDFPLNVDFYVKNSKKNDTPVADNKKKRNVKGHLTFATVAFAVTALAVLANRGFFRGFYKQISNLYFDLSNKVQSYEVSGQTKSFVQSLESLASRGLKKILDLFKLSANMVAVRDSGVDKLLNKSKIGSKFANWTRRVFGNIATNELDRRYDALDISVKHFSSDVLDRVTSAIDSNSADLNKVISIKGKEKPLKEWLMDLGREVYNLRWTFENGFSKDARIARDRSRTAAFRNLPERQWEKITKDGGLLNFKKYHNYITDELTAEPRTQLKREIDEVRKIFSNNVTHEYSSIKAAIKDIADSTKIDDKDTKMILVKLRDAAEKFKSCHGLTEVQDRQRVIGDMNELVSSLQDKFISDSQYSPERLQLIQTEIDRLYELIQSSGIDSQGSLQKISSILKGLSDYPECSVILSKKDFSSLKNAIHRITKKMNTATQLEADDYFIKKAEIKIGSAPTDIFGLMGPLGVGAYAIARGKTKDEKVEAALTAAVPLIGGIGTYIFGTVKMFSAAKNVAFSFVTGIVLNILGQQAVKLYREYQEKQSLVKIALESYNSLLGKNDNQNI